MSGAVDRYPRRAAPVLPARTSRARQRAVRPDRAAGRALPRVLEVRNLVPLEHADRSRDPRADDRHEPVGPAVVEDGTGHDDRGARSSCVLRRPRVSGHREGQRR